MFTTVAHFTDPIEAHLARGRLASEGIDARLDDEHLVVANWEWRLAIGGIRLRVADAHAELARDVLRALDAGEYALHDDEGVDDTTGQATINAPSFETRALRAPDRESFSGRLAWLALMLFGIPLPWRRKPREAGARRSV